MGERHVREAGSELDLGQPSWCHRAVILDGLRAMEISIRERLVEVRTELASVVATLREAERAKEQIAAGDGPKDGAYRQAADERFGNLRDRVALTLKAESDRERLRAQETALLVELEKNRKAFVRAGVRRVVLPALLDIPDAAPCATRWAEMTGDGDERTCTRCKKVARNVAMLEASDDASFPAADPNAPFHRRADGTILMGNCKEGLQSQRLTRTMSIGLVAIVMGIGGLLFYTREESKKTLPPATDSFEGTPQSLPAPETPPIVTPSKYVYQDLVHDITSVHVVDTSVDHGKSQIVDLSISAFGPNMFVGFLTCNGSGKQLQVDLPSLPVFGFFGEINKTPNTDAVVDPTSCAQPGVSRKIKIDVVMPGHHNEVTLTMDTCTGQWIENGTALQLDDPMPSNPFPSGINGRYRNLLSTLPRTACTPQNADPPKPATGHKDPPYRRDPIR